MEKSFLLLVIILAIISPAFAQYNKHPNKTIHFIDSLVKANNIEYCQVYAGTAQFGGEKYKFKFHNNFLLLQIEGWRKKRVQEVYYNIDKLVYFYISEGRIFFMFPNTYSEH
jgi:hypothetical protein